MTLKGILSSRSQKKIFLLSAGSIITVLILLIILISICRPEIDFWISLSSLLISILASSVFAICGGFFIWYFFTDLSDVSAETILLPQDIKKALLNLAADADVYKIYVRTGRHFRAEILPVLIETVRNQRQPVSVEIILIDCRDVGVCKKYAAYREISSFDKRLWDVQYVQKEVLATMFALKDASERNQPLFKVDLFLSKRLSIFRFEGSAKEIIVTREDPRDNAYRYSGSHRDIPAFQTEFNWIKEDADHLNWKARGVLSQDAIEKFFDTSPALRALEKDALGAVNDQSPYVR